MKMKMKMLNFLITLSTILIISTVQTFAAMCMNEVRMSAKATDNCCVEFTVTVPNDDFCSPLEVKIYETDSQGNIIQTLIDE